MQIDLRFILLFYRNELKVLVVCERPHGSNPERDRVYIGVKQTIATAKWKPSPCRATTNIYCPQFIWLTFGKRADSQLWLADKPPPVICLIG